MAKAVSDEELQLKKRARRRLVGAIVLVTAVAVVLPMVLDSEPKPAGQSINIQIPSPDAGVLTAKPEPLKPADVPAPAVAEAPKADIKSETKVEVKPEVAAAPKPDSKATPITKAEAPVPAAKPEASAKAKDAPKVTETAKVTGGFAIQVVALSDTVKAKELQAKINSAGLKAYTEVVQTAKGPVTRVRVGPYASREAAEKARAQLQKLQLDGKVVPR
jgi:DedD protein